MYFNAQTPSGGDNQINNGINYTFEDSINNGDYNLFEQIQSLAEEGYQLSLKYQLDEDTGQLEEEIKKVRISV
jgi:hypothetical protein